MTKRADVGFLAVVTVPALALAGAGLTHPGSLTAATGEHWRSVHRLALPLFPLLAVGPWLVARSVDRRLGWVVALLGYVYAMFYTALDVLAGIGAGALQVNSAPAGIGVLFTEGDALARIGTVAYLLACVLSTVAAAIRTRLIAVPGAVLVIGAAWSFRTSHIFAPRGVVTMLALALGWAVVAAVLLRRRDQTLSHR